MESHLPVGNDFWKVGWGIEGTAGECQLAVEIDSCRVEWYLEETVGVSLLEVVRDS